MRFLELSPGVAGLVTIGAVVWYASRWAGETEAQLREVTAQVSQAKLETAAARKSLSMLQAQLAELQRAPAANALSRDVPSADEVAAILVRDYSDRLRGPKGEKGDPGGAGGSASPSNSMVKIDFSKVSSGIRLDGIEWGVPNCTRKSNDVKCEVLVRNDSGEDERNYYVYMTGQSRKSIAFTDVLTSNSLSGLTSKSWGKKYDNSVTFKFPSGIVYPLEWTVLQVPKEARGFTRMDVGTEDGLVKYENIPIN